jgi:acyl-coenzyme A thioesterase PaaI-like protein
MNTRDLKASHLTLKHHQPGVTLAIPANLHRRGRATNFRGRARVKRLRLRKLQRTARRRNRPV